MELYPQACKIAKGVNFRTDNFKLSQSLFRELAKKTAFGRSKKEDKEATIERHRALCAREGKAFNLTDVRLEGIYSHSTFKNYLQVGGRFLEYLDQNDLKAKNITRAVERYGVEYLKSLEDREVSPYTILQAKSCLGKITGKELDFSISKEREVTKGRSESLRGRTFSEEQNKDLISIAKGTGGRRGDLERLEPKDFVKQGDICIGVNFEGSKGGRSRYTPILPEYQKEISKIVTDRELSGKKKIFDRVNSHANIHAYRREYCQSLYKELLKDKGYRDRLVRVYENRGKDMSITKEEYKTRDGRVFDRQSLAIASQALGHNRLDVIPKSYFK